MIGKQLRDRSKDERRTASLVRRLIVSYLKPYASPLAVAVLFMVIAGAMTAIFAKLIEPIIDDALIKAQNEPDAIAELFKIGLMVLGCFVIKGLATYGQSVKMAQISQGIVSDIQRHLFSHFLDLDLSFFRKNPSGQLVARMISDVAVMRTAVADALTGIGGSFLTLLFLIGIMIYQDWALSLAVMTLLPLASFFIMRLGRRLRKISRTLQQQNATLADRLIQIFQGIRQVKAYGTEDHERTRAAEAILSVRDLNIRSMNVSALITPFNEFLLGATIFGMLIYGGLRIVEGHLTAGELLSFITAFSLAYEPMKKLAKLNSTLQIGLGAAERVFDMIDTQRAIVDRPGARAVHFEKAPAIVFDNVSFRYDESDQDVLNGMDFKALPGQVTALVGRSGGGKSTVLNLILRFYEAGAGRVLLDGNDINDITLASLRAQMALVSQDITLFDESVADNIAYAAPGASRERVMEAARAAQAHDFIMNLPDGYDTKLGEQGMRLSGGQRQRISIARALLKNAPVLLLDEATSALDAESEQAVQASLDLLGRGRTTLVIAHRLTTIQKADRILVVEQGRIAQSGTHGELLKAGGIYADLYEGMLHEK